ncbi:MAG: SGNH/GDSL hydrolase family protein [Solirubrobacterales bacterium]|nr:SGNH/GDSL hydrolase family protein [Solirubrobacterales bacterium]
MIRLPALLAWLAVLAVSFMLPVPAKASVGDGYLRIGPATRSQVAIEASRRKASGNSRPAFIKVGDSNLANHYSMYGLGCYRFRPAGLRPSLVSLVGRYRRVRLPIGDPTSTSPNCNTGPSANSFSRFSFAARGGMTAAYPFVTGAEAGFPCEASTLTCEINAVKPRYALIGFGTNEAQFAAGTTMSDGELAAFALELEEIVRTTRASGVTPVLITAPFAVDTTFTITAGLPGRVVVVNRVIRQLAQSRRVPLIDLWFAQKQVIGPARRYGLTFDGVHLSSPPAADPWPGSVNLSEANRLRYGMNLRNYLVLVALEKLDGIPPAGRKKPGRLLQPAVTDQ